MLRQLKMTLVASIFVVIACGSDNHKPTGLLTYDEDPVYATALPDPTPTILTPRPKSGAQGSLTIAAHNIPSSLDVHQQFSPSLAALGPGIVYSRLLRIQNGPSVELPSLRLECELCSSWRWKNPTTLELFLRPDVHWPDIPPVHGRPLSSRDVLASLQRQRTPGWPNAAILQSISQISVEGETISFELKAPNADFLLALADGHTKILPVEFVLASEFPSGSAVGSGPWLLDTNSTDNSFIFTRNHTYFEEHVPYLNELRMVVLEDEGMRLAAFRVNELDALDIPTSKWDTVHRLQPDLRHQNYPALSTGVELTIRTTKEPFNDIRMRRALFQALNPWILNTWIWGDMAVVGSGLPIGDPEWLISDTEWRKSLNNASEAQDVLSKLKAIGTPVEVVVADYGEQYVTYGRGVVEQLREGGFDASIELVLPREHKMQVMESGQYMVSLAPPFPINTPNAFMFGVLHSNGQANHTGYRDVNLDRFIVDQSRELDPKVRRRQILQIQRHIVDHAVRFMPAAHIQIWAWWPRVMNFYPNFANYEYSFWSRVWVQDQ